MEKNDKQVVLMFSTTNEKTTYQQLLQSKKENRTVQSFSCAINSSLIPHTALSEGLYVFIL